MRGGLNISTRKGLRVVSAMASFQSNVFSVRQPFRKTQSVIRNRVKIQMYVVIVTNLVAG